MSVVSSAIGSADRLLVRLRRSANLSSVVALCSVPVMLFAALPWMQTVVLFAFILAFIALKLVKARRTQQVRYQLAFEEQFMLTPPPSDLLEACIDRNDHFWQSSLVLQGIRSLRHHPPARLLPLKEKRHHLYRHIHDAFSPLRRQSINLDGLLLLVPLGISAFSLSLTSAWLFTLSVLILVVAGGLEFTYIALQQRLPSALDTLEEAIADWMLQQHVDIPSDQTETKPYVHTLLYQSRPWFVGKAIQKAPVRQPLREVA